MDAAGGVARAAVPAPAPAPAPAPWVEERFPDIVVGIDFGLTCTGVAYSIAPDWGPPKTIQHWPGKLLSELANKVPTSLVYTTDNKAVQDWGFGCENEENVAAIKEFFKLHLVPHDTKTNHNTDSNTTDGTGITQADARRWSQDYISCIYEHIIAQFTSTIPGFKRMRVEFIFSVPTTWKDVRMIEEIRFLIDNAIRQGKPNHWACIGLTEAEAAAVYACRDYYQTGDILLVCDSGGGTTDVNVLKLTSSRGEPLQLQQLGTVEGRPIGSVFIDRTIHKLITDRLCKISDHLTQPPPTAAWKMLTGRFQRLKCAFGAEATRIPRLTLEVPCLKISRKDFPVATIYDGQMHIEWEYIKRAFDDKINEMCELLDGQIENIDQNHPGCRISYLVLSGGFGSSPYVRQCLNERYAVPGAARMANVMGLQVLMADEPQLAVVHGLVLDRIQQLKQGVVMFGSRCCPVSYGIVCDLIYDPVKHMGERVRRDPRDGNLYAIDQVEWLIVQIYEEVQGQTVPHTGISKEFQLKMRPGEEHLPWKVHIVMSPNAPATLPKSMNSPTSPNPRPPGSQENSDVKHVCSLDICTESVDRKMKNKRWFNTRPRYWRAVFDVRVVVGAADLNFQLWSNEARIGSRGHEPIQVKWMPAEGG